MLNSNNATQKDRLYKYLFFGVISLSIGYGIYANQMKIIHKHNEEVTRKLENTANVLSQYAIYELIPPHASESVTFGDSITRFSPVAEILGAVNRGVQGATTADMIEHIKLIKELNPKKVYLMAGTNDILQGIPEEQIVNNIDVIKNALKSAQVIVLTIPPQTVHSKEVENFNKMLLARIPETLQVPFDAKEDVGPDGVHLLPQGYKKIINLLEKH